MKHLKFIFNEEVEIQRTGSVMDGKIGKVVGVAQRGIIDVFVREADIVLIHAASLAEGQCDIHITSM